MIGLEDEGDSVTRESPREMQDDATVEAQPEENYMEFSSTEPAAIDQEFLESSNFSEGATQSETEWNAERLDRPFEDEATREQPAMVSDDTDPQESTQRLSNFAPTRELEDHKTNLSKVSILSRLSRIVSRVSTVGAIDYENAQTHIQPAEHEELVDRVSSVEDISVGTIEPTRKTRTFEYDPEADATDKNRRSATGQSAGHTAHFDYDEASGIARFVVLEGKVSAQAFYLGQLPLRLGRDPLNEIVIDDANVSRYHAEIRDREGRPVIVDVGSTNGIKVNGAVVPEAELKSHDVVQIGDALFEFLDPGVLSKGVLQAAAVEAAAPKKPARSKRNLLIAAFVILGVGAYLVTSNRKQIGDQVAERSKQLIASKVESEVAELRSSIEKAASKSVADIPAEEVKKAFLERVEQTALISLLPTELRQQMAAVPADILKIFVEDSKMLSNIVASGANLAVIQNSLRMKLSDLIQAERFSEALSVVSFLYANNPADEKLKKWKSQLEERVGVESAQEGDAQSKTEEILKAYINNFETLLERGKIKDALNFAKQVRANALDSIKKFPQFADRAKAEAEAWGERVKKAEALYEDYKRDLIATQESDKEADDLFQEINSELDFANVPQARKLIDEFLKKYPMHNKVGEVFRLKKQLEEQLGGAFASTKTSIETLIKAESYENAWTEIYRFLDQMPDHQQALELKMTLDKQTAPRATQYYNQARVFEYEADDLVAAEQYYKKTLDVSDPRGELYKKAQRRYADVKRKSIR